MTRAASRSARPMVLAAATYAHHSPKALAEEAQEIKNENNHQDGPQADACSAARTPAAVPVVATAATEKQYQKNQEDQHFIPFSLQSRRGTIVQGYFSSTFSISPAFF